MKLKTALLAISFLPLTVLGQDSTKFSKENSPQKQMTLKAPDTGFHANGIKKQFIVSGGFGYSSGILYIMSLIHGANPEAGLGAIGPNSFNAMPAYCFTADYGISYRATLGIAFSYQQVTASYDTISGTEKFTRLNMSTRLLYHFCKNSIKKDWYFGIRWGLSFWTDNLSPSSNNATYPYIYSTYFSPTSPVEPSLQILLGWKRWFTYGFGMNIEAGIGSPYFLEGGLNLRIGKH